MAWLWNRLLYLLCQMFSQRDTSRLFLLLFGLRRYNYRIRSEASESCMAELFVKFNNSDTLWQISEEVIFFLSLCAVYAYKWVLNISTDIPSTVSCVPTYNIICCKSLYMNTKSSG